MEIMDINNIKRGVIFNKQDPRFESMVANHVIGRKRVMLETNKNNKYLHYFYEDITNLSNRCFFVQKGKEMFACGIENCSIDVLYENGSIVHCCLSASFHLYSTICGFYRISDVLISQKTLKKIKDNSNNIISFRDVTKNQIMKFDAVYFYLRKESSLECLKWQEVFDVSYLNAIYFKTCQAQCTPKNTKYAIAIFENNHCCWNVEDAKFIYTCTAIPSIIGYVMNDYWEFYDFIEKKVKYRIANTGYYKEIMKKREYIYESYLQALELKQKDNPLLTVPIFDILTIIKQTAKLLENKIMYRLNEIKKFETEDFKIIFKSDFSKISNIAIIYASQFKTFKRLSLDTYYVSLNASQPEHIEMMYFILRKMKYVFDDKFMEYINSVSVLRIAENIEAMWFDINNEGFLTIKDKKEMFYSNRIKAISDLYRLLYDKKIKQRRNDIYNKAIADGFKLNKWASEQKLYALIVKRFNDAIFQYHNEWLGLQSLDVYIPSLKIAFEYQGEQHYTVNVFFGGEERFAIRKERDARKRKLCLENGVTLIEWRYDEKITKENLATKLQPFIDELPEENLNYTWEDEKIKLALEKEQKGNKEKAKPSKPKAPARVLVQYDTDGNYMNHFISQEEASKETGASKGTISFVINGRQKTSGGYVWRYFDIDKIPEKIEKTEITTSESKEVMQLDLDGNITKIFPSITSASKTCGVCTKNIRNVINGKQKTAGGYKWKLKE